MSRWHRENPEYYEQYGEPDWLGAADMERKRRKEESMCVICSELPATVGIYCARCARGLDDDRYERECNR